MKRFLLFILVFPIIFSCAKAFYEDINVLDMEAELVFGPNSRNWDPAFMDYCLNAFDGRADGVKDGMLQVEEIKDVKTVDCSGLDIRDLFGIEAFGSLDTLICRDNKLMSIPMDQLPNVRYLDCSGNTILWLNVSESNLKELFCCPMTDPDTGRNALQYLYVRRGQNLPFITSDRDKADPKRVPDETMVIAIPEAKDEPAL